MTHSNPSRSFAAALMTPGQKFSGCYVLQSLRGQSADTVVWMAHDEVLGKDVALHFLADEAKADSAAVEALRNVVKRNRQLVHANVLRVHGLVEEPEGLAIVTDSFDAKSLAELRSAKPAGFFEIAEVKPWLAQICATLEDAHRMHLAHRALSLDNVYVDPAGKVLIANFGVSACLENKSGPGTLQQTAAEDIHALGILLHELLAGAPPAAREGSKLTLMEHRAELGKAGGPIPLLWEKAVTAALEKAPERQIKNISEWASLLGLAKSPTPAVKPVEPIPAPTEAKAPAPLVETAVAPVASVETPFSKPAPTPVTEPAPDAPSPAPMPVAPATVERGPRVFTPLASVKSTPFSAKSASAPVEQSKAEHQSLDEDLDIDFDGTLENAIPENYPRFNSRRGRLPLTGVAAGLVLISMGAYALWSGGVFQQTALNTAQVPAPLIQPEASELTTVANPRQDLPPPTLPEAHSLEGAATPGAITALATSAEAGTLANDADFFPTEIMPDVAAAGSAPKIDPDLAMAAAKPKTAKPGTPPAVAPTALFQDPALAAKMAELDAAKKAAEAAEKSHLELLKQKEQAEAALSASMQTLDEKQRAAAPAMQAAEEIAALRQRREEEMRVADQAAQEAQKIAAEKTRLADEARKAAASVEIAAKDKLAAQQRLEADLNEVKRMTAQREKRAAELAKTVADAQAKRETVMADLMKVEQEATSARIAAEKAAQEAARKAAEEAARLEMVRKAEAERRERIRKEMDDAKRAFDERMRALEESLRATENGTKSPAAPAAPAAPANPASNPPAANPPSPSAQAVSPAPAPEIAATPESAPEVAAPATVAPAAPAPAVTATQVTNTEPMLMAKAAPPKPPQVTTTTDSKTPPSSVAASLTNSLGMKFVKVGDVQFSVWLTRVKDFEVFANATGLKSTAWRNPGFEQNPDHPVVNVTWMEAMAFCKWLTFKEQREGVLAGDQAYRLPTDLEWSRAVGLPEEPGKTPEARDMSVPDVYPWGTQWPPPPNAGNYTGEETGTDVAIKGYNDGFTSTAPVGSFAANRAGLYDMGGNVWQWVMDAWNAESKSKVLRGASWYNGALKLSLLSSCRVHAAQDSSTDNYGFRCVIASESGRGKR